MNRQNSLIYVKSLKLSPKSIEELRQEILNELSDSIPLPSESSDAEELRSSGITKYYFYLADLAHAVVKGNYRIYFNVFIVAVTCIAAVIVGVETFPEYQDSTFIVIIEWLVFTSFVLEFFLKLLSEKDRPWQYFSGPEGIWNSFDFLVLIFCVPNTSQLSGGRASMVRLMLRILRLTRLLKLMRTIPALRVILNGIMQGIGSFGYIMLLIVMIMYLYSIVGVVVFGPHDSLFFRGIFVAFLTLFHALTYDNWGTNLFISMYGCEDFTGGLYISRGNLSDQEWQNIPVFYRCENPKSMKAFAVVYWVSYLAITSLMLLSLFIGVLMISMTTTLEEVRIEAEEVSIEHSCYSTIFYHFFCLQ